MMWLGTLPEVHQIPISPRKYHMKSVPISVRCQQSYQVLMTLIVESFQAKHLSVHLLVVCGIITFLHLKLFDSEEQIIVGNLKITLSNFSIIKICG
jgi:hypothetical protein